MTLGEVFFSINWSICYTLGLQHFFYSNSFLQLGSTCDKTNMQQQMNVQLFSTPTEH